MKKLTGIFLFLLCLNSFGQSWVLTPSGLRDSADTAKNFVILKVDSTSAKDLYANTLKWMSKALGDPDSAILEKVEGESMKYRVIVSKVTMVHSGAMMNDPADVDYTALLNFKPGRIRCEITAFSFYTAYRGKKIGDVPISGPGGWGSPAIYEQGKLKREGAKKAIEDYFNDQLISLKDSVNAEAKKANW